MCKNVCDSNTHFLFACWFNVSCGIYVLVVVDHLAGYDPDNSRSKALLLNGHDSWVVVSGDGLSGSLLVYRKAAEWTRRVLHVDPNTNPRIQEFNYQNHYFLFQYLLLKCECFTNNIYIQERYCPGKNNLYWLRWTIFLFSQSDQ